MEVVRSRSTWYRWKVVESLFLQVCIYMANHEGDITPPLQSLHSVDAYSFPSEGIASADVLSIVDR